MKKKKILLGLALGLFSVGLVSCGGGSSKKEDTTTTTSTEEKTLVIDEFKVTFLNYDGTELYSYVAQKGSIAKYEGDQPFIFADSTFDPQSFGVLKTDAPYLSDRIYELKTKYWNECLTYLGISNLSVQKKERLITDEAIRSMGGTIASRYSRLTARQQAADKINKMFGLNISVSFRDELDLSRPEIETQEEEQEEEAQDE